MATLSSQRPPYKVPQGGLVGTMWPMEKQDAINDMAHMSERSATPKHASNTPTKKTQRDRPCTRHIGGEKGGGSCFGSPNKAQKLALRGPCSHLKW